MSISVISSTTLTSNASSLTFSSIPATYTDLWIKLQGKTNINGDVDGVAFKLNGTSASSGGYAQRQNHYGNGASAEYGNFNGTAIEGSGAGLDYIYGDVEIYIPAYTNSDNKSIMSDSSTGKINSSTYVFQSNQIISSGTTAAVSSITIDGFDSGGTQFVAGTTATLYGIKNS